MSRLCTLMSGNHSRSGPSSSEIQAYRGAPALQSKCLPRSEGGQGHVKLFSLIDGLHFSKNPLGKPRDIARCHFLENFRHPVFLDLVGLETTDIIIVVDPKILGSPPAKAKASQRLASSEMA